MATKARDDITLTQITVDEKTPQHFWFDAEGAHVSDEERPVAGADGTVPAIKGKNVLLDSSGLSVREGETPLSEFTADRVSLGLNSTKAVVDLCGGTTTVGREVNTSYFRALSSNSDATGDRAVALGSNPFRMVPGENRYPASICLLDDQTIWFGDEQNDGIGDKGKSSVYLSADQVVISNAKGIGSLVLRVPIKAFQQLHRTVTISGFSVLQVNGTDYCYPLSGVSTLNNLAQMIAGRNFSNSSDSVSFSNGDWNAAGLRVTTAIHNGLGLALFNRFYTGMVRINWIVSIRTAEFD